jgi:hypothetical protein
MNMNTFFAMVVQLAKIFIDSPAALMMIIILVGTIFLIWTGRLQGAITFGG